MQTALTYLAAPYSAPDQKTVEWRMEQVGKAQAALLRRGWLIVTPLSNHHILKYSPDIKTDWDYWKTYSTVMLSKCDNLIILDIPGWRESTGVQGEIAIARYRGIPMYFYNVETDTITEIG